MTWRRLPGAVVAALALVVPGCSGSSSPSALPSAPSSTSSAPEDRAPTASASTVTSAPPSATAGLAALLLTEVPSGLPRVPDDELDPPAGRKAIEDVAGYARDAEHQRAVLEDYGYRWGWERFWRSGDQLTSVFLDQFERPDGALAYADDLARNDEEYYGGVLAEDPPGLATGCRLLTVDQPDPAGKLAGPAAFAWCERGVFTVSIAAVSTSPQAARAEVQAVTAAQLERLPGR
jgi:hypothetical protein